MKSWHLEEVTELAKEFKYTFYVPPKSVIEKLDKGNLARLIFLFHSDNPEAPRAERMWVEIKEKIGEKFVGYLTNMPVFIEELTIGDEIEFEAKHIIDSDVKDDEKDLVEKYIHRCVVSKIVTKEKKKIKYLYREEGLGMFKDDIYDSGWRIMSGEESQEYIDNSNNSEVISLGSVLNIDETIIQVLDAPVGSEFEWNDEKEEFLKIE